MLGGDTETERPPAIVRGGIALAQRFQHLRTIHEIRPLVGAPFREAVQIPEGIAPALVTDRIVRAVGGPVEHGVDRPESERGRAFGRGLVNPSGLQMDAGTLRDRPPVLGIPTSQEAEMPEGGRRVTLPRCGPGGGPVPGLDLLGGAPGKEAGPAGVAIPVEGRSPFGRIDIDEGLIGSQTAPVSSSTCLAIRSKGRSIGSGTGLRTVSPSAVVATNERPASVKPTAMIDRSRTSAGPSGLVVRGRRVERRRRRCRRRRSCRRDRTRRPGPSGRDPSTARSAGPTRLPRSGWSLPKTLSRSSIHRGRPTRPGPRCRGRWPARSAALSPRPRAGSHSSSRSTADALRPRIEQSRRSHG